MSASRASGCAGGRGWAAWLAVVLIAARCTTAAAEQPAPQLEPVGEPLSLAPPTPLVPSEEPAPPTEPGAAAPIETPGTKTIRIDRLAEIDLEGLGTLDAETGGFGVDLWRGSDRGAIEKLLPRLSVRMSSPTMRDLARRLLLSAAPPPDRRVAAVDRAPENFLALRLERLAALGDADGLASLLRLVPRQHDDQALLRMRVDALLLRGDVEVGCREVRNGLALHHDEVYWRKALVLCQLVTGQIDAAMLGLGLLREQGLADDPAFAAVVATLAGGAAELPPAVSAAPLYYAMLLASGRPLPVDLLEQAGPGLLAAVARASGRDLEERARAAEKAVAAGALAPSTLAEIYAAFSFDSATLDTAISTAPTLAGPRGRALLYRVALDEKLAAARAEQLRVALETVWPPDLYRTAAGLFRPLLAEVPPQPALNWFAESAGRALYVAGSFEQAQTWLALARQQAGANPRAARAVAALWPYARLSGGSSAAWAENLATWPAADGGSGKAQAVDRRAFLRACFQALGEADPLRWIDIAAAREDATETLSDVALLFALQEASTTLRKGEVVLLALLVLGEPGPAADRALVLSSTLAALSAVGLRPEARALAIEAAVGTGL